MENLQFVRFVYDSLPHNISKEVKLFIACQFALESDFGTSNLAIDYFNYCGMRQSKVRPTLQLFITPTGFGAYKSFEDCLSDYFFCLFTNAMSRQFNNKIWSNLGEFKHFISLFYCPDKEYICSIEHLYNQYLSIINPKN